MVVPLGADETLMTLVGAAVRGMIGYVWKPIWPFHVKFGASNHCHCSHCPILDAAHRLEATKLWLTLVDKITTSFRGLRGNPMPVLALIKPQAIDVVIQLG